VIVPTLTPSMLATFEHCPHQYHRKYVEKKRASQDAGSSLACGTATHAVLHGVLDAYRRTGVYPNNLGDRVESALLRSHYPDSGTWQTDVDRVVGWVQSALAGIDETARVLQIERWLEYRFPGNTECPPFLLRHRIDLVLEHQDGTLEHRDWKTGARAEVDELQNVAARIVVRTAFPEHPRILSSTAFLAHGLVQIDELTREQVRTSWQRIKRLASSIVTEQEWLPVSNALCPWCPFYQRGCPLYSSPDGGVDATTTWLEGAA
jgi:RecB family exonuclease